MSAVRVLSSRQQVSEGEEDDDEGPLHVQSRGAISVMRFRADDL